MDRAQGSQSELAVARQRGRLSSQPVQDQGNDMARLLSVNVGRPRDIVWKGRTVHTGIWKDPVPGNECMTIAEINALLASRGVGISRAHGDGGRSRMRGRPVADAAEPGRRRGDERGGTTNRKRIQTRAVFAWIASEDRLPAEARDRQPTFAKAWPKLGAARNRPPSRVALRRGTIRRVVSERGPAMSEPRNAASRMACQPKLAAGSRRPTYAKATVGILRLDRERRVVEAPGFAPGSENTSSQESTMRIRV